MAEEIIQRQAAALRRSYNPKPGLGLNGTIRQSMTQPEQLDRLLSGMGKVINSANNELQRRGPSTPDTIIGTQQSGSAQRARLRQLLSYKECDTDACVTRRMMQGASPEQRARIRRLDQIGPRPGTPETRQQQGRGDLSNNNNGRVSPSGMRGRRSHRNAGRPKGF